MKSILETINAVVWNGPVLLLILITGIVLSVKSKLSQITLLPEAIHSFINNLNVKKQHKWGISGHRALWTALAATVGTGNIAGVAGAIALGGPGVVFWMWICALLGMVTKFAEVTLAVHYRTRDYRGKYTGGPMYMIQNGLPSKYHFLSYIYCFFGAVASFGIGNAAQINAVTDGIRSIANSFHITLGITERLLLGILFAALIFIACRNGVSSIGNWAEIMVPVASFIYIALSIVVLVMRRNHIPNALMEIINGAFAPQAITGGVLSSIFLTIRLGVSRGIFTNEAGMGTASIAHASAEVNHPVEQGMMGIIEVFLDTVVICTLTALVILCSNIHIPYGTDPGISLTLNAFSVTCGEWSRVLLTLLVCIFAFATVLGWGLYGGKCVQYIFGEHVWNRYICCQAVVVVFGTVVNTSFVWTISEIVNGLMAIPNLIAIIFLMPVFVKLLNEYENIKKAYSSF